MESNPARGCGTMSDDSFYLKGDGLMKRTTKRIYLKALVIQMFGRSVGLSSVAMRCI